MPPHEGYYIKILWIVARGFLIFFLKKTKVSQIGICDLCLGCVGGDDEGIPAEDTAHGRIGADAVAHDVAADIVPAVENVRNPYAILLEFVVGGAKPLQGAVSEGEAAVVY